MLSLEDFNRKHDKGVKTPFELAVLEDKVRNSRKNIDECNVWEKRWVEIMATRQKTYYTYNWQEFFPQVFSYKKPFILNGHLFTESPSNDGTLPDDPYNDGLAQELFSESSEDESVNQE